MSACAYTMYGNLDTVHVIIDTMSSIFDIFEFIEELLLVADG